MKGQRQRLLGPCPGCGQSGAGQRAANGRPRRPQRTEPTGLQMRVPACPFLMRKDGLWVQCLVRRLGCEPTRNPHTGSEFLRPSCRMSRLLHPGGEERQGPRGHALLPKELLGLLCSAPHWEGGRAGRPVTDRQPRGRWHFPGARADERCPDAGNGPESEGASQCRGFPRGTSPHTCPLLQDRTLT